MTIEAEVLRQLYQEAYKEVCGEVIGSDPIARNVTRFISRSKGRHRPPRRAPREVVLFEWSGHFHSWDGGARGRGPWDSIATEILGNRASANEAEGELHRQIEAEVRRLRENGR